MRRRAEARDARFKEETWEDAILRIAIHNHYAGKEVAETEFAKRICLAATNLGWEPFEAATSADVNRIEPDFVIALHFRTPKLTKYPTYGSMVTPPAYFLHEDQFIKNILSFNGYLSSSAEITRWLNDILYGTRKKHFIAPFYTTCQATDYRRPDLRGPRLLYAGTNWDGPRFKELFERLDQQPYMDVYGPAGAWPHAQRSYRGSLPFDGGTILEVLNAAGVGLCLHRDEHCLSATPSSRIFEIVASGAIAICQEHPFIREEFGDSVLYLNSGVSVAETVDQISEFMRWIQTHPDQAVELSQKAYNIFAQKFTLEKLLAGLVPYHRELNKRNSISARSSPGLLGDGGVQYIVRTGDRGAEYVERALESVAAQTHDQIGAIVVRYQEQPAVSEVLKRYSRRFPITIVDTPRTGFRSSPLWVGLKAVSAEYFGVLDDDDVIHPGHVESLLALLRTSNDYGVAYSGAIRIWESPDSEGGSPGAVPPLSEPAELAYFMPFSINRLLTLDGFITSNAFLAKSALLKELAVDPQLPVLEDLFLLLLLSRKTNFAFSYEASSEFYWRCSQKDNSVLGDRDIWKETSERIRTIFWKQDFPVADNVGRSNIDRLRDQFEARLEHTDVALAEAEAKLQGLTLRLNRYTNFPFLGGLRRLRRMLLRLPPPPEGPT